MDSSRFSSGTKSSIGVWLVSTDKVVKVFTLMTGDSFARVKNVTQIYILSYFYLVLPFLIAKNRLLN